MCRTLNINQKIKIVNNIENKLNNFSYSNNMNNACYGIGNLFDLCSYFKYLCS